MRKVITMLLLFATASAQSFSTRLTLDNETRAGAVFTELGAKKVNCPLEIIRVSIDKRTVRCAVLPQEATRGTVDALDAALRLMHDMLGYRFSSISAQADFMYAQSLYPLDGTILDFWVQSGFQYIWVYEYGTASAESFSTRLTPQNEDRAGALFAELGAGMVDCPLEFIGESTDKRTVRCALLRDDATRATVDTLNSALRNVNYWFGYDISSVSPQPDSMYAQTLYLPDGTILDFWVQPGFQYLWVYEYGAPRF